MSGALNPAQSRVAKGKNQIFDERVVYRALDEARHVTWVQSAGSPERIEFGLRRH